MAFTEHHEQELAEVKAIAGKLDQRVAGFLSQLDDIERAQNEALGELQPILAFVHIPKTAGGTVTSMLTAAYSKQAIRKTGNYVRNPEKADRKIALSLRGGVRVSAGHTPYGALRAQLPPGTRYMTFLREPVDRVLSHYYRHIHRKRPKVQRSAQRQQHRLEVGKAAHDPKPRADSIEEALVDLRLPEVNNLTTRFLCGHRSPMEELPATALDDAKECLDSFAFVGIQERFEESLVLLQRILGLGSVPYRDRHVNSGGRPSVEEIAPEQRALIEEHNALDAELYKFGLKLFEDAVAAADESFMPAVEALRGQSAAAREGEWQEARLTQDPERT